jgi:hypothetical protein
MRIDDESVQLANRGIRDYIAGGYATVQSARCYKDLCRRYKPSLIHSHLLYSSPFTHPPFFDKSIRTPHNGDKFSKILLHVLRTICIKGDFGKA